MSGVCDNSPSCFRSPALIRYIGHWPSSESRIGGHDDVHNRASNSARLHFDMQFLIYATDCELLSDCRSADCMWVYYEGCAVAERIQSSMIGFLSTDRCLNGVQSRLTREVCVGVDIARANEGPSIVVRKFGGHFSVRRGALSRSPIDGWTARSRLKRGGSGAHNRAQATMVHPSISSLATNSMCSRRDSRHGQLPDYIHVVLQSEPWRRDGQSGAWRGHGAIKAR